ncbi:hypothetical protein EDB81DRAFT_653210 [Dactylonectria macrodidyma]|uniref:Zn(2)-C6 fungal-type domain-containing protein n=1 Tax=Dactylonectria macrodidyma TaxID=307937 RepID=A0A9P9EQM6_9HYPO|nr:hypothetical protein EDB81DRAFT_653210 [Dactylonectria macrodidyma]
MSNQVLTFNKPCNDCRRRKVRCDKGQPCNNCTRLGVSCAYEAHRESVLSRQHLHERVERLERMVEKMVALSVLNAPPPISLRSGPSSESSYFSSSDDCSSISADAESQVFRLGNSYQNGPDSWMSIDQHAYEPQPLLNVISDKVVGQKPLSWPLSPTSPNDMSHFHLPTYQEDVLMKMFFDHVEPFIRTSHQGYYWQVVTDYRKGTCISVHEVEAFMFATQYITATVLPASLVQERLGVARSELSNHLQKATELALDRANLMGSRSTTLLNALLYYVTCQFHTGNCETGSTLLGLAGNIGRRIGMHRDPARYGYGSWIVEMRRRMWGHIAALDVQSATMDGHDSVLLTLCDVQRSYNADDADWKPSPLRTDPGACDREGFSDATASLIRRELGRACRDLCEAQRTTSNCDDLIAIVNETEMYLQSKFFNHFDESDPMQLAITHWYNAAIKWLHRLVSPTDDCSLYDNCLGCLEEFERGEQAAIQHHWQWAFRWPMPIHCIAGLLSGLARQPHHPDTDRAWTQIDVVFQRYNNEDISMAKIPAWKFIEDLCDQAMLKHPNRAHEGCSYIKRIHNAGLPPTACEPHRAEAVWCDGMCSFRSHENTMSQPNLSQIFCMGATNLGFTFSETNHIFFSLDENNEFPTTDIDF